MRQISLISLIGLFALMVTIASADDGWTLQRDRDDIKIWTRLEKGNKIESYKAQMILPVSQQAIVNKLITAEAFASWAPDIRDAKTLKDGALSYIVYAMPFPVKDRDLVQTTNVVQDKTSTHITMDAAPDAIPEKSRLVRVLDSQLIWHLESLSESKTRLTSIGYTDPRGVPPFVINMLIVEGPFRTMKALRNSF